MFFIAISVHNCKALWGTEELGRPAGQRDKTTPFLFKIGHIQNDNTESQKVHNTTTSMTNNRKSK